MFQTSDMIYLGGSDTSSQFTRNPKKRIIIESCIFHPKMNFHNRYFFKYRIFSLVEMGNGQEMEFFEIESFCNFVHENKINLFSRDPSGLF